MWLSTHVKPCLRSSDIVARATSSEGASTSTNSQQTPGFRRQPGPSGTGRGSRAARPQQQQQQQQQQRTPQGLIRGPSKARPPSDPGQARKAPAPPPPAAGAGAGANSSKRRPAKTVGGIPRSILHDPNLDTHELDPNSRWSEFMDDNYYRELARGEGTRYIGTEVDIEDRRSWPRVAGLPPPSSGPRMEPPDLVQKSNPAETEIAIFWHLTPEGLEAILTGRAAGEASPEAAPSAGPASPAQPARSQSGAAVGSERRGSENEEDGMGAEYEGAGEQGKGDPFTRAQERLKALNAGEEPAKPGRSPVQRLADVARLLRHTLGNAYAEEGSMLVFATRDVLEKPIGPPDTLTPKDIPETPFVGLPFLPGDVPVPGGFDKLERLKRVRYLEGLDYRPGEVLDNIELLEAASEARQGAGKAGSRGTGPRPEEFDPWAWLRERRKKNLERRVHLADRPWEQKGFVGAMSGWGGLAGADKVGFENPDKGEKAGPAKARWSSTTGAWRQDASVRTGELSRQGSTREGAAGVRGRGASTRGGRRSGARRLSSREQQEREAEVQAEDEAARLLEQLGPDPWMGLLKQNLAAARDEEELWKVLVEEEEGVPFQYGHMAPGLRRVGVDLADASPGDAAHAVQEEEEGEEGEGEQAAEERPMGRNLSTPQQSSSSPSSGLYDGVYDYEELPFDQQQVLTAGDILELSAARLRRLPASLGAQGTPVGQILVQELQAYARRHARREQFHFKSPSTIRRTLACVVSDDPNVLRQLPTSALSGLEIIVVSSNMRMANEYMSRVAPGPLLSLPALLQGWYLPGSAVRRQRIEDGPVPFGRGFKGTTQQQGRGWWVDGSEAEEEGDGNFKEFLRRVESMQGGDADDDEDSDGDGVAYGAGRQVRGSGFDGDFEGRKQDDKVQLDGEDDF